MPSSPAISSNNSRGPYEEASSPTTITSPSRRHADIWQAQVSDLMVLEGDDRGLIFFSEIDLRKKFLRDIQAAWEQLEKQCCTSTICTENFECAGRSRIALAEEKAHLGLLRFFDRDTTRIRKGYADHGYVNFLAPPLDAIGDQYLHQPVEPAEAPFGTAVATTGDAAGLPSASVSPADDALSTSIRNRTDRVLPSSKHAGAKKRMSVALTSFHKELFDLQNIMSLVEDEGADRLELVMWEIEERSDVLAGCTTISVKQKS